MKRKTLYTLFTTFFKIGLLTFGGGYSMLPFIEKEITEKNKFITQDKKNDIKSIIIKDGRTMPRVDTVAPIKPQSL